MAPTDNDINKAITAIHSSGLNLTDKGTVKDFLGVRLTPADHSLLLHQPILAKEIISDLRLNDNSLPKSTPSDPYKILGPSLSSKPFDNSFNYKSIIEKLLYLKKGSRPDLSYSVHQCARFSNNPRKEHGEAVRWIGRYLLNTYDKGTMLTTDKSRGLEIYVDSNFAGDWKISKSASPKSS